MLRLSLLFLFLTPFAHAQQPSPWQGEWAFDDPSGSRLTIPTCSGSSCDFNLSHGGCGTSTTRQFTLTSPTDATANLPGPDATHSCQLHLHRDASTIDVTQSGTGCSYYCISNATGFNVKVTQRSPTAYAGNHAAECLNHAGPARMATCHDATLAALESNWESLYPDYPLAPLTKGTSAYTQASNIDSAIIAQCNTAATPADCLRARFAADIATMQAHKSAVVSASTERGDPATAHALALKIAGRYRHRFANGDVQGEHFTSTDTMTLTPVGAASIHFDIELNFYNGHTCSVSGGALFRKDGTFVFDDDPTSAVAGEPACRLALVPNATGVAIKDLGGCKESYCGMRGGFTGAGFSFTDRHP